MPRARNKEDLLKFSAENYATLMDLIAKIWKRHQSTPFETAKKLLDESHKKSMALVEKLSDEQLFTKKFFPWTGTTDLGSYFVSAMSSHYEWAIKKIKLHCKKVK